MLRRTLLLQLASLPVLAGPILAACESSSGGKSTQNPIYNPKREGLLAALPKQLGFDMLTSCARNAGMEDELRNGGPFTLFAPTDQAFGALGEGKRVALLRPNNRDQLVRLLRHHLVAGVIEAREMKRGQMLRTLAGTDLKVDVSPQGIRIDGANLKRTNIRASNGIIHVIDAVMQPPRV